MAVVEAERIAIPQRMRLHWLPDRLPAVADRIVSRDQRGYWLLTSVKTFAVDANREQWLYILASRHVGMVPVVAGSSTWPWDCTGRPGSVPTAADIARSRASSFRPVKVWQPGVRAARLV